MREKSIGFIGGGRITRIFLEGLSRAGDPLDGITVSDINKDALNRLSSTYPEIKTIHNENKQAALCNIVVLAVHPQALVDVLPEVAASLQSSAIVISLAPKITIPRLISLLGGFDRVARMIPNAASIINAGFNPIAFSEALTDQDRSDILRIIGHLGQCPVVTDDELEAYAIITAMGPTYFWFQWAELLKVATHCGLSEADAKSAIKSMVIGAVRTMFESGMTEGEVFDLIPVKPLSEEEYAIRSVYASKLEPLYEKLKT
ncbi:MAG: NAD(P)-binding domain-containing protein [Armatimonadota bacterium]|nr:NAD(P)-binding domain-containing protein [Armatimonadota bacterium]